MENESTPEGTMHDRGRTSVMRRRTLIAGLAVAARGARRAFGERSPSVREHRPEGHRAGQPDRARQRRRRQQSPLHRRAGGVHPVLPAGRGRGCALRRGGDALPRHPLPHHQRRRARPAGTGVPSPVRDQRLLLRLLHERGQPDAARPQHRRHRDRALHRHREPGHRRPRLRAHPARDPALAVRQPQRRPDRLRTRRLPVRGGGRRRQRRRSRRERRRTRTRCSARSIAST